MPTYRYLRKLIAFSLLIITIAIFAWAGEPPFLGVLIGIVLSALYLALVARASSAGWLTESDRRVRPMHVTCLLILVLLFVLLIIGGMLFFKT